MVSKERLEEKARLEKEAHDRLALLAKAKGKGSVSGAAEKTAVEKKKLDVSVDPKGYPHLGPVRCSKPRFREDGGFFVLLNGIPMPVENDFDTSGSFDTNIDLTYESLPHLYETLTQTDGPLNRYDLQMAHGNFNDAADTKIRENDLPPICRSQFEANEKISQQLTQLFAARDGQGNHKEESQLCLFAAAYLTKPSIWAYGLSGYHFLMTDELCPKVIDAGLLRRTFGDDVFLRVRETGHSFDERSVPDTAQAVKELVRHTHAFALLVPGHPDEPILRQLWPSMYGAERVVYLTQGAKNVHLMQALIISLTEGTLDLLTATDYLQQKGLAKKVADQFVQSVSHIPIGAQKMRPNFDKIPPKGSVFRSKTDVWPITPEELVALQGEQETAQKSKKKKGETKWRL